LTGRPGRPKKTTGRKARPRKLCDRHGQARKGVGLRWEGQAYKK